MCVIVREMASAPAPTVPPQRTEDPMERTKNTCTHDNYFSALTPFPLT